MNKLWFRGMVVILCLLTLLVGCSTNSEEEGETETAEEIVTIAEEFIQLLEEEKFEEATHLFDATMKSQLTPDMLHDTWALLLDELGEYHGNQFDRIDEVDGYRSVFLLGDFESMDVRFNVTFDQENLIAGFYIQ